MLKIVPITLAQANAFVQAHHRHHAPVVGHRWSIGVENGTGLCGVAICGRPVARMLSQTALLEINRLATDGTKNACSKLYATCAAIAKLMGFADIETAILESERGTSLKAAGFAFRRMSGGGDWNRPSRGGRRTDQPMCKKQIWGKCLMLAMLCVALRAQQLTVTCPAPGNVATISVTDPAHPAIYVRIEPAADGHNSPLPFPAPGYQQAGPLKVDTTGSATLAAAPGAWLAYYIQGNPYWQSEAVAFTCASPAPPVLTPQPVASGVDLLLDGGVVHLVGVGLSINARKNGDGSWTLEFAVVK